MPHSYVPVSGFRSALLWCLLLALTGMMSSSARAQCDGQWTSDLGAPGTDHTVWAMAAYDPDGSGPLGMHVAMTGYFQVAGNIKASRVALYDNATGQWKALGSGLDGAGFAIKTMSNGDLVVGGNFIGAGGASIANIARWNGSTWLPLGPGLNAPVYSLFLLPGGDLLAAGSFTQAGDLPVAGVARWNGTAWSTWGIGTGGHFTSLGAIDVLPNGDIVAAGRFAATGGSTTTLVARWDGSQWTALGTAFTSGSGSSAVVSALLRLPNGDLIAGGAFNRAGGGVIAHNISRWNGVAWSAIGEGLNSLTIEVEAIDLLPNGNILVSGYYLGGNMVQWDGFAWTEYLGGSDGTIHCTLRMPDGDLYIGGALDAVGSHSMRPAGMGVPASNIGKWNGSSWSTLGTGFVGGVSSLLQHPNGDVLAAGTLAGSSPGFAVARRSGTHWSPLLAPVGDPYLPTAVRAMTLDSYGDLYVCGLNSISKFTESGWMTMAPGLRGNFYAIAVLPNDEVVIGGDLTLPNGIRLPIARWNGTSWSSMGTRMTGWYVGVLDRLSNGDLVAGGNFTIQGGDANQGLARWNGSDWVPFSTLNPGGAVEVETVKVLGSGDLLVAARLTLPGPSYGDFVLRWNGLTWSRIPCDFSTGVTALAELPDGDIIVGGRFHTYGGYPPNNLARWNGTSWVAMGSGVEGTDGRGVTSLLAFPNGDLLVAGWFSFAGGIPSVSAATWHAGDAATITTHPTPRRACNTGSASFAVVAQSDSTLSYRWRHNNQPIDTGLNPSAATATLTIAHAAGVDAGLYDCVVTNACASVTSHAAQLKVCVSDFNCDGAIDFFDFDDFVVCFEGIACPPGITADFDHDGAVDFFDYDAFINAFESPC